LTIAAVAAPVSRGAPDAVATDLPPNQSVTEVAATAPAQLDPQTTSRALAQQVILLDTQAAAIVGLSSPEDPKLRRRAYDSALRALKPNRRSAGTDRKA
jgi:hypothetical protein